MNYRIKLTVRVVAVAFLLVLCCCKKVNNAPDRWYNGKPRNDELEGIWEPNEKSLKILEKHGFPKAAKSDHKIELYPDGTCFFKSYPTYLAPDIQGQELIESKGTWHFISRQSLVPNKGVQSMIQLDLQESPSSSLKINFNLAIEDHKFILWNYIGDPDDNEYFDFKR